MQLDQLLRLMTDRGASDLHLKPMRPPLLRVHGRLMPIDSDPLTPDQIRSMVDSILSPVQQARLEERLAVDLGHGVRGLARFRGNVFMQRGTMTATFRRIPIEVQELTELGLPDVLMELCDLPMGLVLVTGPTGSGKSTTLAALINRIARRRSGIDSSSPRAGSIMPGTSSVTWTTTRGSTWATPGSASSRDTVDTGARLSEAKTSARR